MAVIAIADTQHPPAVLDNQRRHLDWVTQTLLQSRNGLLPRHSILAILHVRFRAAHPF